MYKFKLNKRYEFSIETTHERFLAILDLERKQLMRLNISEARKIIDAYKLASIIHGDVDLKYNDPMILIDDRETADKEVGFTVNETSINGYYIFATDDFSLDIKDCDFSTFIDILELYIKS